MSYCIDKLIGIKDTCDNTVYSHWMDSIGITLQELNQYNLAHYASGKQLFEDKKAFSWKILTETLTAHIAHHLKGNSVDENGTVGFYPRTEAITPIQTGKYVGVELENCSRNSPVKLFVSTLSLDVDFTGPVDIYVFDMLTKRQIDTFIVDAVAGERVDLFINKEYRSQRQDLRLAFVYDSQFASQRTQVTSSSCKSCAAASGFYRCSPRIHARGITSNVSGTTISGISRKTETHGMFIDYSVQCDYELWACGFSNKLVLPLMYLIAAEIMAYAIEAGHKVRNNNSVNDVEVNQARREGMMMKYHEHMNLVIKSVNIPDDHYCFNCRKPFIYT